MIPIRTVLSSPRFMREVSILLFGFAAVTVLFSLLMFGGSEPEALVMAISGLVQSAIYVVLGLFVRRGSIIALSVTGLIFTVDTVLLLTQASGRGAGVAIVTRGILIFVVIRYVLRERANG